MKHTEFVLCEAEFFLNKMKESQNEFPHFNYFLNAYISAARSVLWIMQSEYGKVPGWLNWYNSTQVDHEKEILLKGIVDMRNRSLKREPLQIKTEFLIGDKDASYNLYDELQPFIGKKTDLTIEQSDHSKPASRTVSGKNVVLTGKLTRINSVSEFKDQDIFDISQQYFTWLKEITEMCMSQFG